MISVFRLESSAEVPASLAGMVHRMANVPFGSWLPGQIAAQWADPAQKAAALWNAQPVEARALNVTGWGIVRLLLDDADHHINPAKTVQGMWDGVLDWRSLIPQWLPFMDALRSAKAPYSPSIVYFDDTERQIPVSISTRYGGSPGRQEEQAWLRAAYNTAVALLGYFGWPPESVVCAGVANVDTPWSLAVPCWRSHVWFGDVPLQPGAVVTLNVGEFRKLKGASALPCLVEAIRECAWYTGSVSVNLYCEANNADHMANLNSPELAQAIRAVKGGG